MYFQKDIILVVAAPVVLIKGGLVAVLLAPGLYGWCLVVTYVPHGAIIALAVAPEG